MSELKNQLKKQSILKEMNEITSQVKKSSSKKSEKRSKNSSNSQALDSSSILHLNESNGIDKSDLSHAKALLCAKAALDKNAENVKILNLDGRSSITDYFVICSGMSNRQIQSMADAIQKDLKLNHHEVLSSEGYAEGRWILIDAGDVIVHIFLDALRDYYHIETLWADAPRISIPTEFYTS